MKILLAAMLAALLLAAPAEARPVPDTEVSWRVKAMAHHAHRIVCERWRCVGLSPVTYDHIGPGRYFATLTINVGSYTYRHYVATLQRRGNTVRIVRVRLIGVTR